MRVCVDAAKCEGHVRCVQVAPEIFHQDAQGHSFTSNENVPLELEAAVRRAEANCPERAIIITE